MSGTTQYSYVILSAILICMLTFGAWREWRWQRGDPVVLVLVLLASIAFCWIGASPLDQFLSAPGNDVKPGSTWERAGSFALAVFVTISGLLLLSCRYLPSALFSSKHARLSWHMILLIVAAAALLTTLKVGIFLAISRQLEEFVPL